jgi:hypothetical protein
MIIDTNRKIADLARAVGAQLGAAPGKKASVQQVVAFPAAAQPAQGPPFLAGLDLGQAGDPTALAIAEQHKDENDRREYTLRHLQRWPLKTAYPDIVRDLSDLLGKLTAPVILICDATGVGRPIMDYLRQARLPVKQLAGVVVTGGHRALFEEGYWRVPKKDLVGAAVSALESGRLRIVPTLKEAKTLIREMRTFKMKVNVTTGNESFEAWREKDTDDLLFAACLTAWFGDRAQRHVNIWV